MVRCSGRYRCNRLARPKGQYEVECQAVRCLEVLRLLVRGEVQVLLKRGKLVVPETARAPELAGLPLPGIDVRDALAAVHQPVRCGQRARLLFL